MEDEAEKKGWIDVITEKLISRKLLTFVTATGLLAFSDLDSETWGMIAVVYIGSQAAVDIVKTYRESG